MPCLTRDELVAFGLVPDYVPLEPCKMTLDPNGVEAVISWLDKLQLGQYKRAFKENSVDKDVLLSLTEDDLQTDFGVQNKYHVRKIILQRGQL